MIDIMFLEKDQITIMLVFLAMYLLCKFDDASGNISRLKASDYFQTISYGSHFVFSKGGEKFSQAKHLQARTAHSLFYILKP